MLRPRPDPTRFYVLAATAPDHPPAPGSLVVGLGPITMPGYLQHPMLATRPDATQVRYADFDRWAEPLPTLFGRALGQDLSALLGARIVPHPWYRGDPARCRRARRRDLFRVRRHRRREAGCVLDRSGTRPRGRRAGTSARRSSRRSTSVTRRLASPRSAVPSSELAQRLASAIRSCPRREASPGTE